jgi:hypothetical protein
MGRDIYNIPKNNGDFTMVHVYVLVLVPTSGSGWEVFIFWKEIEDATNEDHQAVLRGHKGLVGTKLGLDEDLTPTQ